MKEMKKQIKAKKMDKPCYLFYGQETFLIKKYETDIKNLLVGGSFVDMNFALLEEKEAESARVADFLQTLPFMAENRMITIKNSGLFRPGRKEESEKMAEVLAHIPLNSYVVFIEDEIDKRSKLYKSVVKYGYAAEFKPLSEKELTLWLNQELKPFQMKIGSTQAVYLVRMVGDDMQNLYREIGKLVSYKNNAGEITKEEIDAICIKSPETKIFEMVGAMGGKKPEMAVAIYRSLLSMKESPIMILSLIARQFRILFQSKYLVSHGETQAGIAAITGQRDFIIREGIRQADNFSLQELAQALKDCLHVDQQIKTGRMEPELAVEMLILKYGSI